MDFQIERGFKTLLLAFWATDLSQETFFKELHSFKRKVIFRTAHVNRFQS